MEKYINKSNDNISTRDSNDLAEVLDNKGAILISTLKEVLYPIKESFYLSENGEKENEILDNFLDELGLEKNTETRYIAYERLSSLNEQPLKLYIESNLDKIKEFNKNLKVPIPNKLTEKDYILNKAYDYTRRLYEEKFELFISKLEEKNILTPFELVLLKGSLNIGKAFNNFAIKWLNHIERQNKILDKKFSSSEEVMKYLLDKNLLEKDEKGNVFDRTYSILKGGNIFSYVLAFPNEVNFIVSEIKKLVSELENYEYEFKEEFIAYFKALVDAFEEKDSRKTLAKWRIVDIRWMNVKSDLQVVHPIEYYEDKYRRAVAPDFTLRVRDNTILGSSIEKDIKSMWDKYFNELDDGKSYSDIREKTYKNLNSVQLYVGDILIFAGTELNGLASAQVIPNDEYVSSLYGKKIFAYPEKTLEKFRNAPVLEITKRTFDEDILDFYKEILEDKETYFKIYDVQIIGHEFGHTLALGDNTEVIMNMKTGNFKNIEEFKATSGGFIAYFESGNVDNEFLKKLLVVHILRVVGLLKYRKETEILPYYFEALIHLNVFYDSGLISFDGNNLKLNLSDEKLNNFIETFKKYYKKLLKVYFDKKDAGEFLFDYVEIADSIGLPKNKEIKDFVEAYYSLYEKIGNKVVN